MCSSFSSSVNCLDAVCGNGQTAARMATDPRIADPILMVEALDAAGIEKGELRTAIVREGIGKGLTKQLMIKIIANAKSHVAAVAGLLEAVEATHCEDDAKAAVTEGTLAVLDRIGADAESFWLFIRSESRGRRTFVRLLRRFKLKEMLGHDTFANAVMSEFTVGGSDFTSLNIAQYPIDGWMVFNFISVSGVCPVNFPIWAATYYPLAILCNLSSRARNLVNMRAHEKPPFWVAFRCVQLMPVQIIWDITFSVYLTHVSFTSEILDLKLGFALFGLTGMILFEATKLFSIEKDFNHGLAIHWCGVLLSMVGLILRVVNAPEGSNRELLVNGTLFNSTRVDEVCYSQDSVLLAPGLGFNWLATLGHAMRHFEGTALVLNILHAAASSVGIFFFVTAAILVCLSASAAALYLQVDSNGTLIMGPSIASFMFGQFV